MTTTDQRLPSRTRHWLIADRPLGRALAATDFRLEEVPLPQPGEGQVLLRTRYLSFDPSQKGMMENLASYAEPTDVGSVMPGQGIGEVLASRSPKYAPGALLRGPLGCPLALLDFNDAPRACARGCITLRGAWRARDDRPNRVHRAAACWASEAR